MQFFPHFHWISIEGKRPLIPENFIRDEIKFNQSHASKITKLISYRFLSYLIFYQIILKYIK